MCLFVCVSMSRENGDTVGTNANSNEMDPFKWRSMCMSSNYTDRTSVCCVALSSHSQDG